jgi:hypothetical protein
MFGYLIVVSKSDKYDYHAMAYLLAQSIKRTQKTGYDKVALVTDDEDNIPLYKKAGVYDKVIFWNKKTFWDGRAYMNEITPWEHTVCLDADMIFQRDYSHWIEYFVENCELYIAPKAYTFRGEVITSDYCRKTFTENELPNLYSAYTFFKKSSTFAHVFFSLAQLITNNPTDFKNMYLSKHIPAVVGTDEAFALAAKIMGIEDQIAYELEFPRFVHMKPELQNFETPCNKWHLDLGLYYNKYNNLKIGTYNQDDIVHYVEKDLPIGPLIDNYVELMKANFKL